LKYLRLKKDPSKLTAAWVLVTHTLINKSIPYATEGHVFQLQCLRNYRQVVHIRPIEDRIRELCERAAVADESEVQDLFAELKALLAEHSQFVRYLAARTLNRTEKGTSSSKAAD